MLGSVNGPIVYIGWGHNDQCLYVGSSSVGLDRIRANRLFQEKRAELGRIEVRPCQSRSAALTLEAKLTYELKPRWDKMRRNAVGRGRRHYRPTRSLCLRLSDGNTMKVSKNWWKNFLEQFPQAA